MNFKSLLLILGMLIGTPAYAEAKQIKIGVNGMVCAFCAQGITKKFGSEAAIQTIDVDLSDKLVTLTLKDKQDIEDTKINQILKDAGYTVTKIDRVPQ